MITEGTAYTAPFLVGEFGIGHDQTEHPWWVCFREYLAARDFDWTYWALNGTQGAGYGRTAGDEVTYGVLDVSWSAPANPMHLEQLKALMAPTIGP